MNGKMTLAEKSKKVIMTGITAIDQAQNLVRIVSLINANTLFNTKKESNKENPEVVQKLRDFRVTLGKIGIFTDNTEALKIAKTVTKYIYSQR